MLSVANKPIMLTAFILSVVVLNVMAPLILVQPRNEKERRLHHWADMEQVKKCARTHISLKNLYVVKQSILNLSHRFEKNN